MASSRRLDPDNEAEFFAGVREAQKFFGGRSRVQDALRKLTKRLEDQGIPYAIVGALALNEFGYRRVTEDIDVLLTAEGLARFKEQNLGRGYVEKFPGSKGVRDTEFRVPIDIVLTGEYPGDGQPKSVVFPDPEECAVQGAHTRLLSVRRLLELKIASGISAPHRIRDLADAIELIRACQLDEDFADKLDPSVQDKYSELWRAAQISDEEEPT